MDAVVIGVILSVAGTILVGVFAAFFVIRKMGEKDDAE
ncbi:hypothetical protein SPV1_10286 [Mariprofundus ferrooxydans PV-1]|jgi:uncharacterized membrane protein YdjX (TVP38/TMEM64 family)|uniref:Uncharacterized protein n=1 Tax=Mariprofundus ferrooxydans PV-1 TaxID=314345 RepID=Q0EVT8_9PROT|nr:hypothetical protein SPV1_10286 [Mariprofundus ferrooxydans PV-1]